MPMRTNENVPKRNKKPTLEDHPGLDADEPMEQGRMMTGQGSVGSGRVGERERGASTTDEPGGPPTLENHPGLDADETTAEGEMMTASGSTGRRDPKAASRRRKDGR